MVDVGVVFTENILRHLDLPENKGISSKQKLEVIYTATSEVASAVITALTTTVVSFLPVFAMQAAEGKLFKPLAFTKTFAMLAALFVGLVVIPAAAHWLFSIKVGKERTKRAPTSTGSISTPASIAESACRCVPLREPSLPKSVLTCRRRPELKEGTENPLKHQLNRGKTCP